MNDFFVVAPGQEEHFAKMLTAGQREAQPECPDCGEHQVSRVIINRLGVHDITLAPVDYLWRYAPGSRHGDWTGAATSAKLPGTVSWRTKRGGMVSTHSDACVRCDSCGTCGEACRFWPKEKE